MPTCYGQISSKRLAAEYSNWIGTVNMLRISVTYLASTHVSFSLEVIAIYVVHMISTIRHKDRNPWCNMHYVNSIYKSPNFLTMIIRTRWEDESLASLVCWTPLITKNQSWSMFRHLFGTCVLSCLFVSINHDQSIIRWVLQNKIIQGRH